MRCPRLTLAATCLLVASVPAARLATAQSVALAPGASVTYDFHSDVFAELVARATLSLAPDGTALTLRVQGLPASTFLTRLSFAGSPATALQNATIVGYRAIDVTFPPPGFAFTFGFAGDPGLGGTFREATVTATLAEPAAGGLTLGAARADVYGFRGNTVPNDAVAGTVSVVPEPGALPLALTGVALLAVGASARRAGSRARSAAASSRASA